MLIIISIAHIISITYVCVIVIYYMILSSPAAAATHAAVSRATAERPPSTA